MADAADHANDMIQYRLDVSLASRPKLTSIDCAEKYCADCSEQIPAARRTAAPWANTCIECQGIREHRAVQRRI